MEAISHVDEVEIGISVQETEEDPEENQQNEATLDVDDVEETEYWKFNNV